MPKESARQTQEEKSIAHIPVQSAEDGGIKQVGTPRGLCLGEEIVCYPTDFVSFQ